MATSYDTLGAPRSYDEDVVSGPATAAKVSALAVVMAVSSLAFFGGRAFEVQTTPFEHDDVLNVAAKCGDGEFVGGCVKCKECAAYEFHNGGCSYFKDSFCTYCEPIANCQRERVHCTTRENQLCIQCDCDDSIGNWTDVELGHYLKSEMFDRKKYKGVSQEQATYSCYLGEQCKPCHVCEMGKYQTHACTHEDETMCRTCSSCGEDDWVSAPCTYFTDTECSPCTHFMGADENKWTSRRCHRFGDTGPMFLGRDAESTPCTAAEEGEFYTKPCTEFADSQATACAACADDRTCDSMGGEFIADGCIQGTKALVGADIVCQACTNSDDPGLEGMHETKRCEATDHHDSEWAPCSQCEMGEYEHTACRLSTDTICPPCYPVNHCKPENTVCSHGRAIDDNDSECVGNDADSADGPHFACEHSFYGKTCDYWRTYGDCGTGAGYHERTSKTGKFKGSTNEDFIASCMLLCDEMPDCVAFEIDDGGESWDKAGHNKLMKPNSVCSLKNMNFGSVATPSDTSKDCFANLLRQPEANVRLSMADTPAKVVDSLVFPGVGCVGATCMLEGNWLEAPEVAALPDVARMLVREAACVEGGGLAGEEQGECDADCT